MASFVVMCEQNVVKILGLKFNHDYQDTKSLRYGHLMIMTDQDHDGSHIKGKNNIICAHVCLMRSVKCASCVITVFISHSRWLM